MSLSGSIELIYKTLDKFLMNNQETIIELFGSIFKTIFTDLSCIWLGEGAMGGSRLDPISLSLENLLYMNIQDDVTVGTAVFIYVIVDKLIFRRKIGGCSTILIDSIFIC